MKLSEIFERAAQLVNDDEVSFCCIAIDRFFSYFTDEHYEAKERFEALFYEGQRDIDGGWFGGIRHPQNQRARVLALLFAAAIARSEGK